MQEINKPLELIMYSATRTEAGGKRSFEIDARAISNYSMSMILPLNNTTKEKKYCCSKKYANYQLFSHGGAPKDIPKLQKEEGYELAFWTPWDAPYNQTMSYFNYVIFPDRHYDKVFGPSYEGCDDVVFNKVERVTPKNVLEEAAIVNNGDFFSVSLPQDIGAYNIVITDVTGKVLVKESSNSTNYILDRTKLTNENRTSIYFITLSNNQFSKTLKFVNQ